jgi:hypothetical protein
MVVELAEDDDLVRARDQINGGFVQYVRADDLALGEKIATAGACGTCHGVCGVIAKAAAAEGSRPLRHVIAHDGLYPLLTLGSDRGIVLRRFLELLLADGLGGQNHAAGTHIATRANWRPTAFQQTFLDILIRNGRQTEPTDPPRGTTP